MRHDLYLPRPENVRGRYGNYVSQDMFHIAERLQELDRSLYVSTLDPPLEFHGLTYNFAISEICRDGQERLVMRCAQLDGRVIQDCERMLRVPFGARLDEAEKIERKWAEEEKQRQLDELYERMGGNMLVQLDRCGFVDRPVSHAKMNPTALRHRNFDGRKQIVLPPGVAA